MQFSSTCYLLTIIETFWNHMVKDNFVRNHVKLLHVYKSRRGFSKDTVLCGGY